MLVRSRSRNRARGGGSSLDNELLTLASYGASDAWDFVADQYIRGGVLAPPGLTVTRASSGYAETSDGRLISFASGVARRTDRGLLVEGARTNLLLRSQEFNTTWTASNVTVTANTTIAPDGTTTADTITDTGSSALSQTITVVASTNYVFSFFAKLGTATQVRYFVWDATNGAAIVAATSYVSQLNASNWVRISVSFTTPAGCTSIFVDPYRSSTGSVFLWGAQLEAAAFPSSYIKTEGSTVTRAADQVEATVAQTSPFSMYVEKGDTLAPGSAFPIPINFDDGTTDNRAWFFSDGTTTYIANRSSAVFTQGTAGTWSATPIKIAGRWQSTDIRGAANGSLGTAFNATAPAGTLTQLEFGGGNGGQHIFGYIRRAAIIPIALTDAHLQGITT